MQKQVHVPMVETVQKQVEVPQVSVGPEALGGRSEIWGNFFSNEKRAPGWLGYIGDEILSRYIGIIINYKDPY